MGLFELFRMIKNAAPVVRVVSLSLYNPKSVKPDNTPLHVKREWVQKRNSYEGYYRTRYGAWK